MKILTLKIFILCPIVLLALDSQPESFRVQKQENSKQVSQVEACQAYQLNAIYAAMSYCDESQPGNSTAISTCIYYFLDRVLLNEKWNILVMNTSQSNATVLFWRFSNCIVNLFSEGKYNRTYYIWPAGIYDNQTGLNNSTDYRMPNKLTTQLQSQQQQTLQQQKMFVNSQQQTQLAQGPGCPQWKLTQLQLFVDSCDNIYDNDRAARCIKRKTKNQLGQYWNVIMYKDEERDYALRYIQCYLRLLKYGLYKRYFAIIRTH